MELASSSEMSERVAGSILIVVANVSHKTKGSFSSLMIVCSDKDQQGDEKTRLTADNSNWGAAQRVSEYNPRKLILKIKHTSFSHGDSPSPEITNTKGNISSGSSNPIFFPRGSSPESVLRTGTCLNNTMARTSSPSCLQLCVGIVATGALRTTPMPTQSDH